MNDSYPLPILNTLPLRERPSERVSANSTACTAQELLAAIIGGPCQIETALQLLTHFGSLSKIFKANARELAEIRGIGAVTAARLRAAMELGLRLTANVSDQRLQIRGTTDAANLLMPEMSRSEQELFKVVLLDTRMYVINVITLYIGNVNSSIIRTAEVFKEAIRQNAVAIIIAHSHPTGSPDPSPEDLSVSRALVKAGKLLDVDLVDHLIIGGNGRHNYVSLKERGLM